MLRLVEFGLFLVPFIAFTAWWLMDRGRGPSPVLLATAAAAMLLLAGALLWYSQHETLGAGQAYVPAQWRNGEIVPGHAASPSR